MEENKLNKDNPIMVDINSFEKSIEDVKKAFVGLTADSSTEKKVSFNKLQIEEAIKTLEEFTKTCNDLKINLKDNNTTNNETMHQAFEILKNGFNNLTKEVEKLALKAKQINL